MDGVKSEEYAIAKREVVKAQERIDQARIEQIERISETQSRQLTALEKVILPLHACLLQKYSFRMQSIMLKVVQARMKQLQDMQKNDTKAAERCVVST